MFFKTMGVSCDACFSGPGSTEDVELQGNEATVAQVTAEARKQGWAISSAGHYCPEHRGRARR